MEFEEFKTKVINKSLTVGDAFDHILAKKLGDSKRNEISGVYKGLIGEDIDLNQSYFDVYDKEPFVKALSVESKSGVHRFKEFGSFETEFTNALRRAGRNEPYRRITDYQKEKGIGSVDFGYQATQIRAKEPMRGVIFSRDFDKIFETLRGKSEPPHRNSTSSSYKTKLNFDEFPRSDIPSKTDQRFQQFLRERGLSYLESRERWERYWKHQYLNWNPQPKPLELSKNFNQFLNEKNISLENGIKNIGAISS